MFAGYLVKVGNYEIPSKYIEVDSYKAAIHGQDLDTYTNTDGITIRKALKNVKPKCEFETISGISQTDFYKYIMKPIKDAYIDTTEKSVNVTMWFAEINNYITHKCYVADIEPVVESHTDKEVYYDSIRIAFISYGGKK